MVTNWLINSVIDDMLEIERRRQRIAKIGAMDPELVRIALERCGWGDLIAEVSIPLASDRRDDDVDRLVGKCIDDCRRAVAGG